MRLSVHYRIPPSEIKDRIGSLDFSYLRAYFEIRPFGDETGLLAALCSLVASSAGATKKDGSPYVADDFLPGERPERAIELPELQDPNEARAMLMEALAAAKR